MPEITQVIRHDAMSQDLPVSKLVCQLAVLRREIDKIQERDTAFASVLYKIFQKNHRELAARIGSHELAVRYQQALDDLHDADAETTQLHDVARRWFGAWAARQLAPLLLLFADDATYANAALNVQAQGSQQLRILLARMLHEMDGTLSLEDIGPSKGKVSVTWRRSCTRIPGQNGVIHAQSPQYIDFEGTSKLDVAYGKVRLCRDDWHGYPDALQRLLLGRSEPYTGSEAGVVVKDDIVCLGGISVRRRQSPPPDPLT